MKVRITIFPFNSDLKIVGLLSNPAKFQLGWYSTRSNTSIFLWKVQFFMISICFSIYDIFLLFQSSCLIHPVVQPLYNWLKLTQWWEYERFPENWCLRWNLTLSMCGWRQLFKWLQAISRCSFHQSLDRKPNENIEINFIRNIFSWIDETWSFVHFVGREYDYFLLTKGTYVFSAHPSAIKFRNNSIQTNIFRFYAVISLFQHHSISKLLTWPNKRT